MLQHLATSGDPDLAATAGRTLRRTQGLVAFRAQLSTGAPSPAALKRQGLRRQVFDCKGTNDLPGNERFTGARHAGHEPRRLQDQFRNLSGKCLLRRVIEITPEKGKPRRQTFGGRRLEGFEQILHEHASGSCLDEKRHNAFMD
jgi:hypothetical protein